jgi:hypothetical protein
MEFKRTQIISDTGTKLGVEVFKDGSINVYMEDGPNTMSGEIELVVDEFDPCELIDLSKKIIEACQKRIESRENDGTL